MVKDSLSQVKTALIFLMVYLLLTGLLYPLLMTGLAQFFFPIKANGSLIKQNNRIIGSRYIGQEFSSPAYFWGRPSATSPYPYNGNTSSGSNLGPSNPDYLTIVKQRIEQLKHADTKNDEPIPVDLVTASGSGLDPEISPYAAFYQASRVAKARQLSTDDVSALIAEHIQPRVWGLLGEPRVNVLALNVALDQLGSNHD